MSIVKDTPERYGLVSRWLHWGIALLLLWQFAGMGLKLLLGRSPIVGLFVGSHASIGTLLLALILLRILWALAQRRHRPRHDRGLLGMAVRACHLALYALMLVVPALAVLRMAGGQRPIRLFGVALRDAVQGEVGWMTAPADLLHGLLAWVFLALIAGHVAMVLVHQLVWRDGTLLRMAGRSARARRRP